MKVKKIGSLLLALVMCFSLMSVAWAEGENYQITVTVKSEENEALGDDLSGFTFDAYQIFSGTYDEELGTLGSIEWGSSIDTDTVMGILQSTTDPSLTAGGVSVFFNCESAADVAAILENQTDDSAFMKAFAKLIETCLKEDAEPLATGTTGGDGTVVLEGLDAGYYLILNSKIPEYGAYSENILKIATSEAEAEAKESAPVSHKTIDDVNDSTGETVTPSDENYNGSADYDIGDHVPYTLTGTIADNLFDYDPEYGYTVIFHDVMTNGLTFDGADYVTVTLTDGDGQEYTLTASDYDLVDYTRDPYSGSNEDGCDFEITIKLFDVLENLGLDSTTFKADGAIITVNFTAELNENALIGNATEVDGTYSENAVGNMNKMYMEYSNNPNSSATGKTKEEEVRVYTYLLTVNKVDQDETPLEGAGFTLYKWYAEDEENDIDEGWYPVGAEVVGGELTEFEFKGLDDGYYKLVETTVPDGYNQCDDIYFNVVAEHTKEGTSLTIYTLEVDEDGNVTGTTTVESGDVTVKTSGNGGEMVSTIENQKGSKLPSTGGIGTTIFYIIGGVLVVGAAVVLIARRRMSSGDAE